MPPHRGSSTSGTRSHGLADAALRDAPDGATIRVPAGSTAARSSIDRPVRLLRRSRRAPSRRRPHAHRRRSRRRRHDRRLRDQRLRPRSRPGPRGRPRDRPRAPSSSTTAFTTRCTAFTSGRPTAPASRATPSSAPRRSSSPSIRSRSGQARGGRAVRGRRSTRTAAATAFTSGTRRGTWWRGTRIRDTRDGVYFSFVDRTDVRDNDIEGVRYGLHYMYSDENRFEGNVFRDNAAGAALMYSKGIVLRHNQFLANQGHRSYGVLLQTVESTMLERQPHRRQHRSACSSRAATATGSSTTDCRNHIGIHASRQLRRQRVRGQPLRRQPAHGRDHRRQPDQPLGASTAAATTGTARSRSISIATASPTCPHRELDLFGELRRELPVIGLLAGSPGERLLRFVHARIALPGLPGSPIPRRSSNGHTAMITINGLTQVLRAPARPRCSRSRCAPGRGHAARRRQRQRQDDDAAPAVRVVVARRRAHRDRLARPRDRADGGARRSCRSCRSRRASTRVSPPARSSSSTRGCAVCRRRASRRSKRTGISSTCARGATGKLSGGTRQRLALAVLSLPDAPVLVLDEPGLSLDPRLAALPARGTPRRRPARRHRARRDAPARRVGRPGRSLPRARGRPRRPRAAAGATARGISLRRCREPALACAV